MTDLATYLNVGVLLNRYSTGSPDDCGTVDFWQEPLSQLYAQMPFPSLFKPLKLNVWHMDHPELDAKVARKEYCLEDYDPNTPGYQVADGLTGGDMALGIFPDGWQPEYTGPARPLTDAARSHARKAMSHEFGHWHQWQCRYGGTDDVARLITEQFRALRPNQASNEYEDWAECYRALFGADECRGYFSDNKVASVKPELKALMQTAYWLQGNLPGYKVTDFYPQAHGVQYRALFGVEYKWRFIGLDWRSQEWVPPANGKPEYWKSI